MLGPISVVQEPAEAVYLARVAGHRGALGIGRL